MFLRWYFIQSMHVLSAALHTLWSYVMSPSKWISSLGDKIVGAVIGSAATIWTLTKTQIWPRTLKLLRLCRTYITGKNYILLWLDADAVYAHRLAQKLDQRFPNSRVQVITSAEALLGYPMRTDVLNAIVLLDTDVSKFSSDEKIRVLIEKRLQVFLIRGGGLVGSHDIIYRRTRNESLERAFGGRITQFRRTTESIKYRKKDALHPIAKRIAASLFSLNDGELLWGKWMDDVSVIFCTDDEHEYPLVVAREHGAGGRLVWLHSCDQQEQLAQAMSGPENYFIELLSSSIEWVSRHGMHPENHPFIVAHRGLHLVSRENTLSAFEDAIHQNADYIETDLRRTHDGILILNHDAFIGPHQISETNAADLEEFCAKNDRELTTFSSALNLLKGRISLDIELKEEGYEDVVCNELRRAGWDESHYVFTSFSDSSVEKLKHLLPASKCGLLLGKDKPREFFRTRWTEFFPVKRLRACGADFVVPNYQLLKLGFCRRLTSSGFPIWVWTVNNPDKIRSNLKRLGIEALITDHVSVAVRERASFHVELSRHHHSE